jgi:hypothetical protein
MRIVLLRIFLGVRASAALTVTTLASPAGATPATDT